MKTITAVLVLLVAACGAAEVSEDPDEISEAPITVATTTTSTPTTSSTTTSSTTTTTSSTTTTTLGKPMLVEPSLIGVWPYRTAEEVLAGAVDGLEQDSIAIIERFLNEHIGWELISIDESFTGADRMGFDGQGSGGQFFANALIVAFTPSGDVVWAIDFASSLDSLEDGWGPSTDIAESEEGWSALINATPISKLTSRPGVSGPYAQISYGEWESDRVLIGPNGASIAIPSPPDLPGVLSIWYLNADDSVAGFSLYTLPPGPFVAG